MQCINTLQFAEDRIRPNIHEQLCKEGRVNYKQMVEITILSIILLLTLLVTRWVSFSNHKKIENDFFYISLPFKAF